MSFDHRCELIGIAAKIGVGAAGLAMECCFELAWLVGGGQAEDVSRFAT